MSANQNQVKANVGSVVAALDSVIAQANANANWNEGVGAAHSPALLRSAAQAAQGARDALFALYKGEEDVCSVGS